MARAKYAFGTFPLGYGIKHFCSRCNSEITDDKAIMVKTDRGTYLGFGVCSAESDDEGNNWRTFCRDCFAEVQKSTPQEVYDTYYPGRYED